MIAIVNVSPEADPVGMCDYEVRLNHAVVARFRHDRCEGLAVCLRLAACAVEIAQRHPFNADLVREATRGPDPSGPP